jgi:hypothetical protein
MAKRKSNQTHTTQRDDTDIATDSEVLRKFITKPKPYTPVFTEPLHLPSFDNRTFHPSPITRTIAEPRSASRLKIPEPGRAVSVSGSSRPAVGNRRISSLPAQVAFSQPKQVSVCIRRKTRREVLFAKQRTGRGAKSRRTRNQWSDVKC